LSLTRSTPRAGRATGKPRDLTVSQYAPLSPSSVRRGSRELRTDGQQRDEPDQHPVSPAQIRSRRAKRLLSMPGRVFGTHKPRLTAYPLGP
jgi:hypothetical protein